MAAEDRYGRRKDGTGGPKRMVPACLTICADFTQKITSTKEPLP